MGYKVEKYTHVTYFLLFVEYFAGIENKYTSEKLIIMQYKNSYWLHQLSHTTFLFLNHELEVTGLLKVIS